MLSRAVHLLKALEAMLVIGSGIDMLVRLLQPEKAFSPMAVTLPSLGIMLFLQPNIKVFDSV